MCSTNSLPTKTLLDSGIDKPKQVGTPENFSSNMVLIGNPGSGKSSLVNCLVQQLLFKSGLSSDGVGVTAVLDERILDGKRYMDTPGLSDIKLRHAAAKAIDSVLQAGGDFQICFVLTVKNNRVQADDLTTMKLVLDAANQITQDSYAIIFNQWKPKDLKKLDQEAFFANLEESLTLKGCPTSKHVHIIPVLEDLDGEDDAFCELPTGTQQFFATMPRIIIDSTLVHDVNAAEFDEMLEKIKEAEEALDAERAEKEKALQKAAEEESLKKEAQQKAEQEESLKKEAQQKAEQEESLKKEAQQKAEQEESLKKEAQQKAEQEESLKKEAQQKAEQEELLKQKAERKADEEANLREEAQRKADEEANLKHEALQQAEQESAAKIRAQDKFNEERVAKQNAEQAATAAKETAERIRKSADDKAKEFAELQTKTIRREAGEARNRELKATIKTEGLPLTKLVTTHWKTINGGKYLGTRTLGGFPSDPWLKDDIGSLGKEIEVDGRTFTFQTVPASALVGGSVVLHCQSEKVHAAEKLFDLGFDVGGTGSGVKVGVNTISGVVTGAVAKTFWETRTHSLDFSDANCPDSDLKVSLNVKGEK